MSDHEDLDDAVLVNAFRAGDETAFQEVLRRFESALMRRIQRRLSRKLQRRVSVADVLQETELAAHQGRGKLAASNMQALGAWLMGIAERKALMHARHHGGVAKRAMQREVTRGARPPTNAAPGRQATPSEVVSAEETRELAQRARRALPPDHQQVLRMALEDGVPLREVAERMGRSYEATRKLYGRAFLRFKQLFAELREEGA